MINYSIIIPHKNSPELLERCLNSIPARKDIEIIVVDDCSDESRRPQTKRDDVKVIYLTKEQTKGAGRARNIGLEKAAGKWLLFADCDDYYINNVFDRLDKFKDTEYDIVFFDYGTNHGSGNTSFSTRLDLMLKGGKRDRANFKHMSNAPWNKMFNSKFVKQHNIQFEEVPIQNDAYFVHKAASLTDNFHYINEKLYFYEINNQGITRRKRKKEDIERSITTTIKIDKLKSKSGAWDCIYLSSETLNKKKYGFFFVIKQHLRRIHNGLIWYMIKKKVL